MLIVEGRPEPRSRDKASPSLGLFDFLDRSRTDRAEAFATSCLSETAGSGQRLARFKRLASLTV